MLSEEFIQQQKQQLLQKKTLLEQELSQTIGQKLPESKGADFETKYPNYGDDQDDNAQEIAEYTTDLGIERTLEADLNAIKSALERIESNNYGICSKCSAEINQERLKALPEATNCIKCA